MACEHEARRRAHRSLEAYLPWSPVQCGRLGLYLGKRQFAIDFEIEFVNKLFLEGIR
jgi:hypothetical protein